MHEIYTMRTLCGRYLSWENELIRTCDGTWTIPHEGLHYYKYISCKKGVQLHINQGHGSSFIHFCSIEQLHRLSSIKFPLVILLRTNLMYMYTETCRWRFYTLRNVHLEQVFQIGRNFEKNYRYFFHWNIKTLFRIF